MTSFDRRLRARRPAKKPVDPWRAIDVHREWERAPDGALEACLTLFLAGRECPFTCIFCDLWRHTTDAPTPVGAIPAQIRRALGEHQDAPPLGPPPYAGEIVQRASTLKLYNASNFFDDKAVPAADDDAILGLVRTWPRVVVECHARLVEARCRSYAERLAEAGSRLEVAVGFETIHPEALAALNKKVDVSDLERAAARLRRWGADLRAFVLLGVPFIAENEALAWIERTTAFALECGARHVSLIPLRGGESELARLAADGVWRPPDLDQVEASFETARALDPARVRLDTWDLDALAESPAETRRVEALRRAQLENFPLAEASRRTEWPRPARVPA